MVETFSGNLSLTNSTISDNTAASSGGAIAGVGGNGSLTLQNATLFGNTANGSNSTLGGGGIYRVSTLPNTLTLTNSIISGNTNTAAPDIRTDPFSTLSANFCAIGNNAGFTLAPASGNNVPFGANLMLNTLANNGGPTQTRALAAGSPLINAGSNALVPVGLSTDQRGPGFARIQETAVDIGAFERAPAAFPEITSKEFLFETSPHRIRISFTQNVAASLSMDDIILRDQTHAVIVPGSALSLSYDSATNTATFTYVGAPSGVFPDARYRVTIFPSGITNSSGVPLPATELLDFHALTGDANRDGQVNFDDLLIIAQNYGTAGKTFSQGNFNYDAAGAVGFDDLLLVAQRYGTSLAALGTPALSAKKRPSVVLEIT